MFSKLCVAVNVRASILLRAEKIQKELGLLVILTTICGALANTSIAQVVYDLNLGNENIRIQGRNPLDGLGRAVASGDINGDGLDDIIIGAFRADPAGGEDAGETYVIYGSTDFPIDHTIDLNSVPADVTVSGAHEHDRLGKSLTSGDVNGDSIDDVIIGAYWVDPPGGEDAGATYVIFGRRTFPVHHTIDLSSVSADITVCGAHEHDEFGKSVSSGDVNGDSIDDIIIGAYHADPPDCENAGETYVIYGSGNFPPNHIVDLNSGTADITICGAHKFDESGRSVSSCDVNGDSVEDILIGAPNTDPVGGANAGATNIIYGNRAFPDKHRIDLGVTSTDIIIYGDDIDDWFGSSTATGDINGDGIDDMIIGAHGAGSGARLLSGRTYVIYGDDHFQGAQSIDLNTISADVTILGNNSWDLSGESVCCGDVNGDGFDDMIVGAPQADPFGLVQDAGEIYVVFGSRSFPKRYTIDLDAVPADISIYGKSPYDWAGVSIASGDINGDGNDDIIIGASQADPEGGADAGEVYVIYGFPTVIRDSDGDEVPDQFDNCPQYPNPDQGDEDADGAGDECDNCPKIFNPNQEDSDRDDTGDACEPRRGDVNGDWDIDLFDVVLVANHILGTHILGEDVRWLADCNGDDTINVLDALGIAYVILEIGCCPP
ncbi:MAG: FG-GAP repeat protein [Gemmatimonadota bacterium]|nr:MAG: FG-GAP repeat protein [Gemmatimonadota bacterium]